MIFAFSMAKSSSRDNPFLQGNPVNGVPASMDSTVNLQYYLQLAESLLFTIFKKHNS